MAIFNADEMAFCCSHGTINAWYNWYIRPSNRMLWALATVSIDISCTHESQCKRRRIIRHLLIARVLQIWKFAEVVARLLWNNLKILNGKKLYFISEEAEEWYPKWRFNVIIILCVNTVEFTTVWFLLEEKFKRRCEKKFELGSNYVDHSSNDYCFVFTLFRQATKVEGVNSFGTLFFSFRIKILPTHIVYSTQLFYILKISGDTFYEE